jgi:hypothetical protein
MLPSCFEYFDITLGFPDSIGSIFYRTRVMTLYDRLEKHVSSVIYATQSAG